MLDRETLRRIRRIQILRSDRNHTLVASGIDPDDLVIISSMDAVTDGMAVRNAAKSAANITTKGWIVFRMLSKSIL